MKAGFRGAALAAGLGLVIASGSALAASPSGKAGPELWGAIATSNGLYGYSFNQTTAAAAENVARSQCERKAGAGACVIRSTFDRACAAMASGNFGEWGVASAPTIEQARKDAMAQCDSHLPTEPCKLQVSVCSAQDAGRTGTSGVPVEDRSRKTK